MTVLTVAVPAVTSLREIVYPVAPGDALKTNAAVSIIPLPVGLIAVGATGATAATSTAVCGPDNVLPALLTARILYTYVVLGATDVSENVSKELNPIAAAMVVGVVHAAPVHLSI